MGDKSSKQNRNFDLGKQRDRRFDLEKDSNEVISSASSYNNDEDKGVNWKKTLGIFAVVVALGGIIYGAYSLIGNNADSVKADDEPITMVADNNQQKPEEAVAENDGQAPEQSFENEEPSPLQGEQVHQEELKPEEDLPSQVIPPTPGNEEESQSAIPGTIEEKANRVIRGDFGNGQVRKERLGEEYAEIQSKVNEMYRNGQVQ